MMLCAYLRNLLYLCMWRWKFFFFMSLANSELIMMNRVCCLETYGSLSEKKRTHVGLLWIRCSAVRAVRLQQGKVSRFGHWGRYSQTHKSYQTSPWPKKCHHCLSWSMPGFISCIKMVWLFREFVCSFLWKGASQAKEASSFCALH